MHKLVIYIQSFKTQSLCNMYFCGLLGRQIQGPPRAAHTLATPLFVKHFYPNKRPSCWEPFAGDIFAR